MFKNGWYKRATHLQSPNFNQRPDNEEPSLVVIHCISLPVGEYNNNNVEDFFLNKLDIAAHESFESVESIAVSAHFYIKRNGKIIQFVSVNDRAWHAGKSVFNGREGCNDFSVGIELQGSDNEDYKDRQYESLNRLLGDLRQSYPSLINIAGHENIAPERKTDPGKFFEWHRVIF
ncbi:1,6-anhydro-N-acetylmuramyl-L-alanine amidase AmpD [Francisella frigiditurris]|uniref:1,6-anhydro-N-acetylmuramyl-L-alanine amidase AmpD n=1 Tax=Francisella frigiditurris TaxID=1542390 RepID=A0A1J0KWC8_9GAMM|nr:1,6-anhydro-N-acetylmuramyl-L-alanine amidase AmpD [Francisella frigiditurris]APC97940.1 N-acetylmuramoyl-L-alanine amidase family protein [Francisella frigiditurris]